MEEPTGSVVNQAVGISTKRNEKGQLVPVKESLFSFFDDVVRAFEYFPIAEKFGLNPKTAMELPLYQWYRIRDAARTLAAKPTESTEEKLFDLLKRIVDVRGEGSE